MNIFQKLPAFVNGTCAKILRYQQIENFNCWSRLNGQETDTLSASLRVYEHCRI